MDPLKAKPSQIYQDLMALKSEGTLKALTDEEILKRLEGVKAPEYADAVFEGGGVKGIALAGAIDVAELLGVKWKRVAGTSAGAITAALLAAGYSGKQIIKIVTTKLDFNNFTDKSFLDRIPLLGKLLSVLFQKGIYQGDFFENWMKELLSEKGIGTFGDFKDADVDEDENANRLQVVASDVTRRSMIVLPRDLEKYGRTTDDFSVSHAIRMSMSIPVFFEPVKLGFNLPDGDSLKAFIVDGGLLSNYPIWIFDRQDGGPPRWPTLGFKLVEPGQGDPDGHMGPIKFLKSLVLTMMEAHDKTYIDEANFKRSIPIPTMGITTTQFDLTDEDKTMLVRSGQEAAIRFFKNWDFETHNRVYRSNQV